MVELKLDANLKGLKNELLFLIYVQRIPTLLKSCDIYHQGERKFLRLISLSEISFLLKLKLYINSQINV